MTQLGLGCCRGASKRWCPIQTGCERGPEPDIDIPDINTDPPTASYPCPPGLSPPPVIFNFSSYRIGLQSDCAIPRMMHVWLHCSRSLMRRWSLVFFLCCIDWRLYPYNASLWLSIYVLHNYSTAMSPYNIYKRIKEACVIPIYIFFSASLYFLTHLLLFYIYISLMCFTDPSFSTFDFQLDSLSSSHRHWRVGRRYGSFSFSFSTSLYSLYLRILHVLIYLPRLSTIPDHTHAQKLSLAPSRSDEN